METGVGAVPPGMALPYCLHYTEKGAPTPHAKMPPLPPNCSRWGYSPLTTICIRSAGCYRWWNPGSGWSCLPWMVSSGDEHPPPLMPGPVDQGPSWWAGSAATELASGATGLGRSKSRGRACFCAPQWAHTSSWSQSPSSGSSRWEGIALPQHWGGSTTHPSWSPSTGTWQS